VRPDGVAVASVDEDPVQAIVGNPVAGSVLRPPDRIVIGGVQTLTNVDAIPGVAQRTSADIQADGIPLHPIVLGPKQDPVPAVAPDQVAGSPLGPANRVEGSSDDLHTTLAVAQGDRTRDVGADVVALHQGVCGFVNGKASVVVT